jgi:hypothetical protein
MVMVSLVCQLALTLFLIDKAGCVAHCYQYELVQHINLDKLNAALFIWIVERKEFCTKFVMLKLWKFIGLAYLCSY